MRIIIFCGVFLFGAMCYGQEDTVYTEKTLVTFSPSAFINFFPGVQFGIEQFVADDKTIEFEFARLLRINQEANTNGNQLPRLEEKNGFRMKLGFKKFISRRAIFLATLYYRNTKHDFEEWVFRDGGSFEQLINYKTTKSLLGPTVGLGLSNKLKNSFYIETAINLGLGLYQVRQSELPDGVFLDGRFLEGYHRTGEYAYPILGLSLKFKYGL